MRTGKQYLRDIQVVGAGFNRDETLKYSFGTVPEGADACYDFKTNTIHLPMIDNEVITLDQERKISCFDRHERLHALLTDGTVLESDRYSKANSLIKCLFQRIEDCRIEKNIHYREMGTDDNIKWYRRLEVKETNDNAERYTHNNRFGYVAMALQYKVCEFGEMKIDEEIRPIFDAGWKILVDGRYRKSLLQKREGTQISLQLAYDIYNAWKEKDNENEQKNGDGQNEEKQENESQGLPNSEAMGNKGSGEETKADGNGEKKEGRGNTKKNSQSAQQGNKDGESKPLSDQSIQQSVRDSILEEFECSNVGEYELDPNKLNKEVTKIGIARVEKDAKGQPIQTATNIVFGVEFEKIIANPFPKEYENISDKIGPKTNQLKHSLISILKSIINSEIEKNLSYGRIHKRSLWKISTGDLKVFKRTKEGTEIDAAVQLVIDLSGSMASGNVNGNTRSTLAAEIAIIFGTIFNCVGIELEVIGFNSIKPEHDNGFFLKSDKVLMHYFKKFDEPFEVAKNRMGAMVVEMMEGGTLGGCNVDHEVVYKGAIDLSRRSKKKKIQIVLSDGQPNGCSGTNYDGLLDRELIRVNDKIRSVGIQQVAIGIQTDAVKKFYKNYIVVNKLEELDQRAIRLMASLLIPKGV